MSLPPDAIVWAFDGRGDTKSLLRRIVFTFSCELEQLMPPSACREFADPLAALMADEQFSALAKLESPELRRLFPRPVPQEFDGDSSAWEEMVRSRSVALHEASSVVLRALLHEGPVVQVAERDFDCWLQVLGANRAMLTAELTGSPERLVQPTPEQASADRPMAVLLDWLAYLIEVMIESRNECVRAGEGLNPAMWADLEDE